MYRYQNNVYAIIHGLEKFPDITGMVTFSRSKRGVLITSEVYGLPDKEKEGVFTFCIHSKDDINFDEKGNFTKNEGCYNPTGEIAPMRAGDLPPLFSFDGYSYMQVVTNRFLIDDIIGKSIIINQANGEYFFSEGKKIACGIILSAG